jgi:hypothetical protein
MNRLNFNITNFQKLLILILIPSLITGPLLPEIISFFLCIIFLIKFYINPNYKYFNKKIFIHCIEYCNLKLIIANNIVISYHIYESYSEYLYNSS